MANSEAHNVVAKLIWSMPLDDQINIMAMVCATTDILDRKPLWYREWIKRQANFVSVLADLTKAYKEHE